MGRSKKNQGRAKGKANKGSRRRRSGHLPIVVGLALVAAAALLLLRYRFPTLGVGTGAQGVITIDYPDEGAIFPPEFPPPTFLWRDDAGAATIWQIEVAFADGSPRIRAESQGERLSLGEIDPRCISSTNELPALTPEQAAGHTWKPDSATWEAIKRRSTAAAATLTISGYSGAVRGKRLSRGQVNIRTSNDPLGAPIFYRDVPLMPSETEKGVIKPLAGEAVPLISWRLLDVGEPQSRLLMEGLPTCANCHSFSNDGSTMGMDMDGPQNDKGLYAIVQVEPQMSIGNDEVVAWSTYRGKLGGKLRVGFMSQLSPDGQYVVTTINDPGVDQTSYQRRMNPKDLVLNYYVSNFKDYRFLQVFYPTRGILAWYSHASGRLEPLPGADDPNYVHTNATWSPDGRFLVFSRAPAKDAYRPGAPPAERANDPNETQIQYDLYRIPFNDGKGGRAEPILGASNNGMSNSFPKISPDGRWIVFVQCRNGQLMRPDSELYIVPVGGGQARRMQCNRPLMNSWHSFSPNGRWLVFASKSRSPYTQMYLTHLDEQGNDSPAILIENATAANRAVNIPEFVNIPRGGMVRIDAPVTEYYRIADDAMELMKEGQFSEALIQWQDALLRSPAEPLAHNNLGVALAETGRVDEGISHYRQALELDPMYPDAHNNLAEALAGKGRLDEAVTEFEKVLELDPGHADALSNLGAVLAQQGKIDRALPHLRRAVQYRPDAPHFRKNLAMALAAGDRIEEALRSLEEGVRINGGRDPELLDLLGWIQAKAGRFQQAAQSARRAMAIAAAQQNQRLVEALKARIASYERGVTP